MRNKWCLYILLALTLTACNPDAKYFTDKVKIDIEMTQYSASYAHVEFKTSRECYYLVGVENIDNENIVEHPEHYMALAVDSAYVSYLEWRHSYLQKGVPYIADFQSHALLYCNSAKQFYPLKPGTEYWVYAFVVNPDTKAPVGELFKQRIRTRAVSEIDMHCDFRIDGTWFYTYPKNSQGNIVDYCPYFSSDVTDDWLQECAGGDVNKYLNEFLSNPETWPWLSLWGVDVFNDAEFETMVEGVTYHHIACSLDGAIANVVHYKYVYTEGMKREFHYPDDAEK